MPTTCPITNGYACHTACYILCWLPELLRRRNHNALNTKCPLHYDINRTTQEILRLYCQTASALRETARQQEDWIYTHYEGWLPDEDERPVTKWEDAWCSTVCRAKPCRLKYNCPLTPQPGEPPLPTFDQTAPDVVARTQCRASQTNTVISVFEIPYLANPSGG